jgi:hypothetical protein
MNHNLRILNVDSSNLKESHIEFFKNRNWEVINQFWKHVVSTRNVPTWLSGSVAPIASVHTMDSNLPNIVEQEVYGFTRMEALRHCGLAESEVFNPKFKRKTFAIQVGYLGSAYQVIERR